MEFNSSSDNHDEIWEWPEEYSLQGNSGLDVSHYLADDVNENEDSFLYMLEDHTPTKDCTGFGGDMMNLGDCKDKSFEESKETSQFKRRRVLRFSSDSKESASLNRQITSSFFKSKVREESMVDDGLPENMNWNSERSYESDDGYGYGYGNESFIQSSDRWIANCLNQNEMHQSLDEMNDYVASDGQIDISEFYNVPSDIGTNMVQKARTSTPCRIFRGRKSYIDAPLKLTTSVAYPFALIKPCGVQGDVTLKDINQRIHAPTPSKSKNKMDEDSSMSYPTSAFSGKPVVIKTKIHTEGGKGSITIMRTKG